MSAMLPHNCLPSSSDLGSPVPQVASPAASIHRIAWACRDCPPQHPAPQSAYVRDIFAPGPRIGLPARVDLCALDRFMLEPLHSCAAKQHNQGRPYVYMHVAARIGPRHAQIDALAIVPWLSLDLAASQTDAHSSAPPLRCMSLAQPELAHIDNIFFFCLLGANCRLQWLGSLAEATSSPSVRWVITTMLRAERGDAEALLRAGSLFAQGVGVQHDAEAAALFTQTAWSQGATQTDTVAAQRCVAAIRSLHVRPKPTSRANP